MQRWHGVGSCIHLRPVLANALQEGVDNSVILNLPKNSALLSLQYFNWVRGGGNIVSPVSSLNPNAFCWGVQCLKSKAIPCSVGNRAVYMHKPFTGEARTNIASKQNGYRQSRRNSRIDALRDIDITRTKKSTPTSLRACSAIACRFRRVILDPIRRLAGVPTPR